MRTTVLQPPSHERRPLARRQFRIKREVESPSTALTRLGHHVISHPRARSGPVNTLGAYLVYLPRITIGLAPKEKKLKKPQQIADTLRRWTGNYHPMVLRDLSDMIPLEMLTPRQRVKTTAVVAAASSLIFAYTGRRIPRKFETRILKDMVTYMERKIPTNYFRGKPGTKMEIFLRGLRRYLLHVTPRQVIPLDDEPDPEPVAFDGRMIKTEEAANNHLPVHHSNLDDSDFSHPSAPPRSRKRARSPTDDRPSKRTRPGQTITSRHENFLSTQYASSETAGLKQLLELAGLGAGDIERCLKLMGQGISARRAMEEMGRELRMPV